MTFNPTLQMNQVKPKVIPVIGPEPQPVTSEALLLLRYCSKVKMQIL